MPADDKDPVVEVIGDLHRLTTPNAIDERHVLEIGGHPPSGVDPRT